MTSRASSPVWAPALLCAAACARSPTEPSAAPSFLAGTWQGTVTIEVNPGEAGGLPATTAATTWTFEVVPQTNMQTFGRRSSRPICGCRSPRSARPRWCRRIHRPRISAPRAITTLHAAAVARSAARERRRRRESTRTLRAWTVAPDSQDASCSPSNEALYGGPAVLRPSVVVSEGTTLWIPL
jgi:hypothetical protein